MLQNIFLLGANKLRPYLQHFISLLTYKWVQQARVFVPDKSYLPCVM